jgi:small basic protein
MLPLFTVSFFITYVFNISIAYWEQFFAVTLVIAVDGVFGIIRGCISEGFKTYKALKIFKTLFTWIFIMATLLVVEKAYPFASWLSETFMFPVIVFYLISALKNASQAKLIKSELLNKIMEKVDQHKV